MSRTANIVATLRPIAALVIVVIFAILGIQVGSKEHASDTSSTVETAFSIDQWDSQALHEVVRVVDGDTIIVSMLDGTEARIRLIGIDTPETVDPREPVECFGKEASEKTHALLDGERVRLEVDPTQGLYDKYGRVLAYVFREDGVFVNEELLQEGYAHEYTYDLPYRYQKEFKEEESSAHAQGKGLWQPGVCA